MKGKAQQGSCSQLKAGQGEGWKEKGVVCREGRPKDRPGHGQKKERKGGQSEGWVSNTTKGKGGGGRERQGGEGVGEAVQGWDMQREGGLGKADEGNEGKERKAVTQQQEE